MWRRVPLLVLLYVTLDFANPLMPGAVRFEAGAVESVQAGRVARPAAAVMPALAAFPTEDLVLRDEALGVPVLARAIPHPVRRDVRRVHPSHSDPSPSPTEDH
jgi:hypothetical protein